MESVAVAVKPDKAKLGPNQALLYSVGWSLILAISIAQLH